MENEMQKIAIFQEFVSFSLTLLNFKLGHQVLNSLNALQ